VAPLTVIHLSFSITILAEKKFEERHEAGSRSAYRIQCSFLAFQPCLREAPPMHLIFHELLAWAGAMRMAVVLEQSSQRLLYDSTNTTQSLPAALLLAWLLATLELPSCFCALLVDQLF
jgi:hypothetical protein